MMLRFRRYRVFLICAIFLTVLLVRFSRRNEWGSPSFPHIESAPTTWEVYQEKKGEGHKVDSGRSPILEQETLKNEAPEERVPSVEKPAQSSVEESNSIRSDRVSAPLATSSSTQHLPTSDPVKTVPDLVLPDRTVLETPSKDHVDENDEILQDSTVDPVSNSTPTPIHWVKQVENFPVPPESIIQLPTGKPISIPKIQFSFRDETVTARADRLKKQDKVKAEFKRAWDGYKSKAWMHDEVRPVSGRFRDPFGGWAATLVDSLDTLWIMGLEEDFEEAVQAVGGIDFTTSTRPDIQVFETVIRYLGGLLGAYDVSGGTKRILLDKAVELAEVLMGVFDTPNRMPDLFYAWKPASASQPHRARSRSNLAELGTLSLEFTRLAQLTRKAKYYDAIARITDALEDWQNRGTNLPGVFPSDVDASGCNRTLPAVSNSQQTPIPLPPNSSSLDTKKHDLSNSNSEIGKGTKETTLGNVELTVTEGLPGEPGKAHIQDMQNKAGGTLSKLSRRALNDGAIMGDVTAGDETVIGRETVKSSSASLSGRSLSDTDLGDWDCVPQGLVSASYRGDKFSMGGGQDSLYEYLPKQYLLLGGLEGKYLTMYLKAMEAVRKNMLYRPMLPDNRDVRFTGKVTVSQFQNGPRLEAEVTHLTCFVGGMFGMGSKIFDIKGDLEIAEKLSDGCVWAYESTASGIMPEAAEVLPCESMENCPWNQTLWEESLDPIGHQRDEDVKIYDTNRAELQAKAEQQRIADMAKLEVEENEKSLTLEVGRPHDSIMGSDSIREVNDVDVDSKPPPSTRFDEDGMDSTFADQAGRKESSIQKRDVGKQGLRTATNTHWPVNSTDKSATLYQTTLENTEIELDSTTAGRDRKTPNLRVPQSQAPTFDNRSSHSSRPMSHKEYVEHRIKEEGLPPGFVQIRDGRYILRPEAIESVWYMYRITGDSQWQDKGWRMFEHIIDATRTTYGHSAIRRITSAAPIKADEMESFWLAETLKYFYLLYSTPDKISLDDYVLNTEAHPFKRPK